MIGAIHVRLLEKIGGLLLVFILFSCATSNDEEFYVQSIETHNLAIRIGEHVNDKIDQIEIDIEGLEESYRSILQDSINELTNDYEYWQSTRVEVEGDDHKPHEGHVHQGELLVGLSPKMMLDIQRDVRDRIILLNIRVQKILDAIGNNYENKLIEKKQKTSRYGA